MSKAYEELKARLAASQLDDTEDEEFDVYNDMREAVIFQESFPAMNEVQKWTMDRLDKLEVEEMTELALSMSLCPIHFRDYAICFDDEDPTCDQVRLIHPSHDT